MKARALGRLRFGTVRWLGLLALVLTAALRISDPAPVEILRLKTFDFYQTLKPRPQTARPVVIVDIDEASLQALGQWPWPRTVVADLVARLQAAGAVAIGFDVIFPEPDRSSPARAAASFRGIDPDLAERLKALPDHDRVLADQIAKGRVVLGQSGMIGRSSSPATGPRTPFGTVGSDPRPWIVTFPGLLENVPALEKAAAGRGLFTIRSEQDGIIRRVPLVLATSGGTLVPALSLEMLRLASGTGPVLIRSDAAGVTAVAVRGLEIPTDRNGQLWPYFNRHDPARYVSAADVVAGTVPADRFARRLVLIGTSAVGLLDIKATPVERAMPGVEIHAQVLENILTKTALSAPGWSALAELGAALGAGLVLVILAPLIGPVGLLALALAVAGGLAGGSWYLFDSRNQLFDPSFPLASTIVAYLVLVSSSYLAANAERRRVRSAFSQYLAPALVEELARSPEKLVLGGETRSMTVMFTDMRGFTAVSEGFKSDPQGLTQLMNRLFNPLTGAIVERKGTIDKYMGDAIMAFWNAPLDVPDHEAEACEAALTMLERLERLNAELEAEALKDGRGFTPLAMGIGLNTGPCTVGNMGSDLHFNYSVMGDTVNLASRLESQSKPLRVNVVLGSRTAEAVRDRFALLELDRIRVKGKSEAETVHVLVGRGALRQDPAFERLSAVVNDLLAHYRACRWPDARASAIEAARLAARWGLSGAFERLSDRIDVLEADPPPADWDGVMVAETK